jgi:hypothetical protein
MIFYEPKSFPPLYTLPRKSWRRRRRLKKIISMRRTHRFEKTPLVFKLMGWKLGPPKPHDYAVKTFWQSTYYSVRGRKLLIPIHKSSQSAAHSQLRF